MVIFELSIVAYGGAGGGGASTTVLHSKRVKIFSNFACTLIFTHNE